MFKTRKSDGRVFNDNKQRSDKHHGSVKPKSGMKVRHDNFMNPSLSNLNQNDANVLRLIQTKYDREGNVYSNQFSDDEVKSIRSLEGQGFIRTNSDGRIVPSWVIFEHPEI